MIYDQQWPVYCWSGRAGAHSAADWLRQGGIHGSIEDNIMLEKKVTCECGKEFRSASDDQLVSDVQKHAREVHNMEMSREQVMSMAQPV